MNVIHITPSRNVESIRVNGILRSVPLLDQYARLMDEDYPGEYDSERGLVFAFPVDFNIAKWIKDFAYWKVWGNPRNECIKADYDSPEAYDKLLEIGPAAFAHIIPADEHLTALEIEIPDNPLYGSYLHRQAHDMSKCWHDMDTRYEHTTKPLALINFDIDPGCIIGQVGTIETVLSKTGKVDTIINLKAKSL